MWSTSPTPSEPLQIARIIQKLEPTSLSINEFKKYRELEPNSSITSDENLTIENVEQFKLDIKPLKGDNLQNQYMAEDKTGDHSTLKISVKLI